MIGSMYPTEDAQLATLDRARCDAWPEFLALAPDGWPFSVTDPGRQPLSAEALAALDRYSDAEIKYTNRARDLGIVA